MKSQSTAALTPVLENANISGGTELVTLQNTMPYPSRADTPMTSRLAMRSLLAATSFSISFILSLRALSSFLWCQSSYSCLISSTERLRGESCLLARRRSGTPRICGAERTPSKVPANDGEYMLAAQVKEKEVAKKKKERTKDLPAFAEPLAVFGVDDKGDGVAVVVVFWPDVADAALATKVPELEDGGGEGDRSGCG